MTLEHDHSEDGIRARLAEDSRPNYLRDWVYGGIDGAVTTFAIVAGVVGAALSTKVILILGLANLLADGFSMAASNYSGTKTEVDDMKRLREVERKHIRMAPDGERQEIRQILRNKGLDGAALEQAVHAITSNEETWVNTMLVEEYGVAPVIRDPLWSALATFAAFVLCGAIPVLAYLTPLDDPFTVSLVMTAAVFFAIGTAKSVWSLQPWWRSGIETLAIGMAAAGMAYGVGYLLRGIG
jgi:VIT1/CCC1 family predicted Fe2+/Mn2+ transporter